MTYFSWESCEGAFLTRSVKSGCRVPPVLGGHAASVLSLFAHVGTSSTNVDRQRINTYTNVDALLGRFDRRQCAESFTNDVREVHVSAERFSRQRIMQGRRESHRDRRAVEGFRPSGPARSAGLLVFVVPLTGMALPAQSLSTLVSVSGCRVLPPTSDVRTTGTKTSRCGESQSTPRAVLQAGQTRPVGFRLH